jgi:pyruvate,orthophosphate dikinase
MAKEVVALNDRNLLNILSDEIIECGFQYPEVKGANSEWQVQVNPDHIKNIRVWMEIIALKPAWTRKLLSALIINLKLGGVLIRDTDLFQRDISAYLNAGLSQSENLSKQLVRLFPVFFNEIGAEGELREVSTRADELCSRRDKLVHFIRKVSHVESNNMLVRFLEAAFHYWAEENKEAIKPFVPAEVYSQIDPDEDYYKGLNKAFKVLFAAVNGDTSKFLLLKPEKIKEIIETVDADERDKIRAFSLVRMFQLLTKKYNPQPIDLIYDLENSNLFELERIKLLNNHISHKNFKEALEMIVEFKDRLTEIILSPEKTVATENIYFKRHIAAGIPSMYGVYKETKFDALSLSMRLESLGVSLFEQLVEGIDLNFITKSTIIKILSFMPLFLQALQLEGIPPHKLQQKLNMLRTGTGIKLFSIDQYHDIFLNMSKAMQGLIKEYYIDTHRNNFQIIMRQMIKHGHEDFKNHDLMIKLCYSSFLKIFYGRSFLRHLV